MDIHLILDKKPGGGLYVIGLHCRCKGVNDEHVCLSIHLLLAAILQCAFNTFNYNYC